jgi:hypothetical protein
VSSQENDLFGLFKKKKDTPDPTRNSRITLEEQLAALEKLGFCLDTGVTVDDVLHSFSREDYEKRPFDLILFILGAEVERKPWGRPFCSTVWNFDTECIEESGDYVRIVERLCRVARKPGCLTEITDFVDLESGEAWLKYVANGRPRHLKLEVSNDWADVAGITEVMADIEGDGRRFYCKDNGQAMVLYYIDSATAGELNRLSNGALSAVLP